MKSVATTAAPEGPSRVAAFEEGPVMISGRVRAATVEKPRVATGRGRTPSVPITLAERTGPADLRNRSAHGRWPDGLPLPLTSFVGRGREIAEAGRLLGATRLLTLTGTGGVGKTRLGCEVACRQLDAFGDSVWLVELAAIGDAAAVTRAVATVLGVQEEPGRPLTATLVDALRFRSLLLVLDNCEHLIEACAEIAETLLSACPGVRILATSRQPLGIPGETTFRVPSLSLSPGLEPRHGDDDVSDAVQLFVERARTARPAFALTERNRAAVEQICRRLDGIPLAIELAAARVAVLNPEQIAARLSDRFGLLTGGSRTALPRYRTLRALIDWSHDLLDEDERTLLRRLAVFAGGWTLEAAESVCAGESIASDDVLDLLSGLVAKSLVQAHNHGDDVRYQFLETLRAFARERLHDAGEETILRERHRVWFLVLAERSEPDLEHAEEADWFDRLDVERENLRAVARRATAQGDAETAVRLGAALWQYWMMQADATDARERVDAILALAASTPLAPARATALDGAGVLARLLGEYAAARALGEESLALARTLGDRRRIAVASYNLGRLAYAQVRYADARALHAEALAVFQEIGHRSGAAAALNRLGLLTFSEGDFAGARALLEESLAIARETGNPRLVGSVLYNLGLCAHYGDDPETARRLYEEWRTLNSERGDRHDLAAVTQNLGHVHVLLGDPPAARALFRESLVNARAAGNRRRLALGLWAIATLAAAERDSKAAVRFAASAETSAEALGIAPAGPVRDRWTAQLEPARRSVGALGEAEAMAAGRALTLEQAIDAALGWLAEPPRRDTHAPESANEGICPPGPVRRMVTVTPDPPGTGSITPREQEVAALIARGMSNRQIADALVIAEGTAANHVKHILARLGLDSRVQIAAWVVEHGLRRPTTP